MPPIIHRGLDKICPTLRLLVPILFTIILDAKVSVLLDKIDGKIWVYNLTTKTWAPMTFDTPPTK